MASTSKKKAKRTASEKQKALDREYSKQVKRIKQFIRRASNRGYRFYNQAPVEKKNKLTGGTQMVFKKGVKEWELPARPKKVTEASIRKLKSITSDYLYERAIYEDPVIGDIFSAKEGKKRERQTAAKKAAVTRKKNTTYTDNSPLSQDQAGYYEEDEDDFDSEEYYRQLERENRHRYRSEYQEPPSGNSFDYIFDDIMALLKSLAPSESRYTKSGKLWVVDEARDRWSNALTSAFLRIQDEEAAKGELEEYAVYLTFVKESISEYVQNATASSDPTQIAANCEAIMILLNRGNDLGPHESDAIQRFIMGEIDEI